MLILKVRIERFKNVYYIKKSYNKAYKEFAEQIKREYNKLKKY